METPLSPNWPSAWIAAFNFLISPLNAFVLPRIPQVWRYTVIGLLCYGFTIAAAALTGLTAPEVLIQGGVLLGMALGGYAAARSGRGVAVALGVAGVGIGGSASVGLILPAFAQDSVATAGIADVAKEAAKGQLVWWISWTFSVLGGWLGRKLDGKRETTPRAR